MKEVIQKILGIVDLRIVSASRYSVINLIESEISPLSIPYYVNSQPALLELDRDHGRTNRWFDLSDSSFDPHLFALKETIDRGFIGDDFIDHAGHFLEINRSMSVPKNAAEQFGIDRLRTKFHNYPFWAQVLPWHNYTIDEIVKKTPFDVKKNRSLHGLFLDSNDPDEIMRIDREHSIRSHAEQYENLFQSINRKGYTQSGEFGFIRAEILVKGGEYRWKPSLDGNHRTILLSAMGVKKIPLLVDKIIRYNEIQYWPNVINGTFTEVEAKIMFNKIFNASPPSFYSEWINYCSQL